MNKRLAAIPLLLGTLLIFSCKHHATSQDLSKPENTNLAFWILESPTKEALREHTYIPGWFGAEEYLDSRYVVEGDAVPEVHVTYLLTNYPDYSSASEAITGIDITDPEITVYGMTFNSHPDQIYHTVIGKGFKASKRDQNGSTYSFKNITFTFTYGVSIHLQAEVTNKNHIVF